MGRILREGPRQAYLTRGSNTWTTHYAQCQCPEAKAPDLVSGLPVVFCRTPHFAKQENAEGRWHPLTDPLTNEQGRHTKGLKLHLGKARGVLMVSTVNFTEGEYLFEAAAVLEEVSGSPVRPDPDKRTAEL